MSKVFLFFLCFLMSCSMGWLRRDIPDVDNSTPVTTNPTPTQPSVPVEPTPPVIEPPPAQGEPPVVTTPVVEAPKDEYLLKMNIKFFGTAATAARKAKYEKAMLVFQKVVSSAEFKIKVLAFKYQQMTADPKKGGQAIYDHILAANEKLQPIVDHEVDMEVEFYYANNSTVGYTYGNVKRIYVNTKFFDGYALPSVAANLIHEWLHKLGYGHDSASTARRPYSVPYGVGGIMRSIGSKYD